MSEQSSPDPLHGVTLEMILTRLAAHYGWEEMGMRIKIRCFNYDPSIKSSLQFLRRTPWARTKVEELYLRYVRLHSPSAPLNETGPARYPYVLGT